MKRGDRTDSSPKRTAWPLRASLAAALLVVAASLLSPSLAGASSDPTLTSAGVNSSNQIKATWTRLSGHEDWLLVIDDHDSADELGCLPPDAYRVYQATEGGFSLSATGFTTGYVFPPGLYYVQLIAFYPAGPDDLYGSLSCSNILKVRVAPSELGRLASVGVDAANHITASWNLPSGQESYQVYVSLESRVDSTSNGCFNTVVDTSSAIYDAGTHFGPNDTSYVTWNSYRPRTYYVQVKFEVQEPRSWYCSNVLSVTVPKLGGGGGGGECRLKLSTGRAPLLCEDLSDAEAEELLQRVIKFTDLGIRRWESILDWFKKAWINPNEQLECARQYKEGRNWVPELKDFRRLLADIDSKTPPWNRTKKGYVDYLLEEAPSSAVRGQRMRGLTSAYDRITEIRKFLESDSCETSDTVKKPKPLPPRAPWATQGGGT